MIFLYLAFLFFSPVAQGADQPIVYERIVDKTTPKLAEQFTAAMESVSLYSKNHSKVMEGCGEFLANLSTCYTRGEGMIEGDISLILEALKFAAEKHQYQSRKDAEQTPYIIHPIGVANHLLMVGKVRDPDILIAALLHDTVEDTNTYFEEILELFGSRVEGFVKEVTDDKTLPKQERKQLQIEHAPHKSAGAAQVKLGDKYYNLNDLLNNPPPDWEQERIDAYFDWAEQVVEALPWVNSPLKNAVEQTIAAYRQKSAQKTS